MVKAIRLYLILFLMLLVTAHFLNSQNRTSDSQYRYLLEIESARKLYRKQHYDDALSYLLKVASLAKNSRIKAEALLEIAYVKYQMGYSAQSFGVFIRKALNHHSKIEISPAFAESFARAVKKIKMAQPKPMTSPSEKMKTPSVSQEKRTVRKGIRDMEIREDLIFQLKKDLMKQNETISLNREAAAKQEKQIARLTRENNSLRKQNSRLNREVVNLKKRGTGNYEARYLSASRKLKETRALLNRQEIRIRELEKRAQKQETELARSKVESPQPMKKADEKVNPDPVKTTDPVKTRLEKTVEKSSTKVSTVEKNVFDELHSIWGELKKEKQPKSADT